MMGTAEDEAREQRRVAAREWARVAAEDAARFRVWAEAVGIPTLATWVPAGWTRDAENSLPTCPIWEQTDEHGVLRAWAQIGPTKSSWRGGAPIAHLSMGLGEDITGAALDLDFAAEDWPKVRAFLPRWLDDKGRTTKRHPPRRA